MAYNIDTQDDYIIESAILSTDRAVSSNAFDISRVISDLEIYEHLDKPYLTGKVMFVDNNDVLGNIDFQGGEKLTITIKPLTSESSVYKITKTFYTQKIISAEKVNDDVQTIVFYLIEDIAFVSSVQNINKSYKGSPSSIISQISNKYLNRDILTQDESYQNKMKVIVPNLHPIEAMLWLKNKTTNSDGLPFYLYSVLADDNLRFYDLGSILRAGPMNKNTPFLYTQAASQTRLGDNQVIIQSFEYNNTDDLLTLIRQGFVGSKHQFYDSLTGTDQTIEFKVDDDAFQILVDKDYFDKNQNKFNYGPNYKLNEKRLSSYNSVHITDISSAGVYKNIGDHKTINQEKDSYGYKKRIIGSTLKNFMTKSPVSMQMRGIHFIDGSPGREHLTIGNTIRVLIPQSTTVVDNSNAEFDKRKSGDYIIYAARHMFSKERYDVKLLCTKLASYNEDPQ